MLERRGIISGYEGSKPRRVLVDEAELDRVLPVARARPEVLCGRFGFRSSPAAASGAARLQRSELAGLTVDSKEANCVNPPSITGLRWRRAALSVTGGDRRCARAALVTLP